MLAWSSFFGAGRSCEIYAARRERARLLLGAPIAWKSKAFFAAGCGLATAVDRQHTSRLAVLKEQPIQLTSTNGWRNELSILAVLCWAFFLRAPSACLPLRRQRTGEDLRSDDRLDRKAVIGLSEGKLITKLNRRKHMAGGSKLTCVCICEEYFPDSLELHVPQLFRPVCQLWPAGRQLASAGEQLLPGRTGEKAPTDIRGFEELEEWHKACRLGTHSSRRGAARATLEAGGSFPRLPRSAQWRSSAYQRCLDVGHEESRDMDSIMVEASHDESC